MSARFSAPLPSLVSLRKDAKTLLKAWQAQDPQALDRRRRAAADAWSRRRDAPVLADAQLVIAREHGFQSWPKLVAAISDQPASPGLRRAFEALREGRPVILFDGEDGENEGDFVYAADRVDAAAVNFMTLHGRGTLCLALPGETAAALELSLVKPTAARAAPASRTPAFMDSIDAATGVGTGVSAADRATTFRAAAAPGATAAAVVTPGHVFPLREADGGLATRRGHTEGSLALLRLAGLRPAAAICEILNEDGSMARRPDLEKLARRHELTLVSLRELGG